MRLPVNLDAHTHGAEFADRNCLLGPTSACLVAPRNQTAPYLMDTNSCGVRGGRVDKVCIAASGTPVATTYTECSIAVFADRSK
jgi:hypothetical protein